MKEEVTRLWCDDVRLVLYFEDNLSEEPFTIVAYDDRAESEVSVSLDLNQAEVFARDILDQVAHVKSVKKRSEELNGLLTKMAQNQAKASSLQLVDE